MKLTFKNPWSADIHDEPALRRYVTRTTALSAAIAVCLDVMNQLIFFSGWPAALRSWIVTIFVAGSIALVASRAIGQAQLALWHSRAELETLSRTDPLTGLANRRSLLSDKRMADTMVLLIADIDRFKQVNDTHGHLVGDDVIRIVSNILTEHLSDLGIVGRLGGEEFAFLSSHVPVAMLQERLLRLQCAVGTATFPSTTGDPIAVTVSGGLALRRAGQSFDALYAAADRALYAAKTSGRNRVFVDGNGCYRDIDPAADMLCVRDGGG